MLPSDLASFIWGLVVGFLVLLFTGMANELAKDCYSWVKSRIVPSPNPPHEPIQVGRDFTPTKFHPEDCAWVKEEDTYTKEAEGYTFYIEDLKNARCYRMSGQKREFFMVKSPELRVHA